MGSGVLIKAGSGSWKQSPTSPEMCGGASTHTTSILALHPIYRFQLDLEIAFCFFQFCHLLGAKWNPQYLLLHPSSSFPHEMGNNVPRHRVGLLGCPGQDQELDLVIPVGLFQLRILFDSRTRQPELLNFAADKLLARFCFTHFHNPDLYPFS